MHHYKLILLLFLTVQAEALCVDSNGRENIFCLENTDNSSCFKSLSVLIKNLNCTKNNVIIELLSDIILDNMIFIEGFENLTIKSYNTFKIACDGAERNNNVGVYIQNCTNFVLENVVIEKCGMLRMSSTSQENSMVNEDIRCAIYIINCTNLTLKYAIVLNNNGTGVVIYNTRGEVMITDSKFEGNTVCNNSAGGGGLAVEFTKCKELNSTNCDSDYNQIENTLYTIQNCTFIANSAHQINPNRLSYDLTINRSYTGLGRGGGMYFSMRGNSNENELYIINCTFSNNTAGTTGGGVYLAIFDNSNNNIIKISHTKFINNKCIYYGGGGLMIGILSLTASSLQYNISVEHSNFTANAAKMGGGIYLVAQESELSLDTEYIEVYNCTFLRNTAELGSAVDASPDYNKLVDGKLPVLYFKGCTFKENRVIEANISTDISGIKRGLGTFLFTKHFITFGGLTKFIGNSGTGLYLISGVVKIQSNGTIIFKENHAQRGGALALHGFSFINMDKSTSIVFVDNEADVQGGAIFIHSLDLHARFYSRVCFLHSLDSLTNIRNENVTVKFSGNKAQDERGNSIYASSLQPCAARCKESSQVSSANLACLAEIHGLKDSDIMTEAYKFESAEDHLKVIPGKFFNVSVQSFDELNHAIMVNYFASMEINDSITLEDRFSYHASGSELKMHSNKNIVENNTLLLTHKQSTIAINVTIQECPPGHVIDSSKECGCETSQFQGILSCDRINKIATIRNGYWIGLCDDEQCTGHSTNEFSVDNDTIELNTRIHEVSSLVCNENRVGKLCGKCTANHSAFYHSPSYKCGNENYCKFGIIFYILSELLPLTIIFIVIIKFNISLTTGAVNGVILYAQINHYFVYEHHTSRVLTLFRDASKLVYSLSNLNYLSIEDMSFCLWKGATALDAIAWKYVTVTYALLLIAVVYMFTTTKCTRCCRSWRANERGTVLNSLAVVLVMCYSQCVHVSFNLMSVTKLRKYNYIPLEYVVTYSGDLKPFQGQHIPYIVIALLVVLTIVLLPPLVLVVYPLGFKVLASCKLRENKVVSRIANLIPMQILDLFQSCFKDNFRFMSGVYFSYRIIPILILILSTSHASYIYIISEGFLVLALALNAVLQPYKEQKHNTVDCLIFANLALINGISLYNYLALHDMQKSSKIILVATLFQIILIYLPLLYLFFVWLLYILKLIRSKVRQGSDHNQEVMLNSISLPPLREPLSTLKYHEMK